MCFFGLTIPQTSDLFSNQSIEPKTIWVINLTHIWVLVNWHTCSSGKICKSTNPINCLIFAIVLRPKALKVFLVGILVNKLLKRQVWRELYIAHVHGDAGIYCESSKFQALLRLIRRQKSHYSDCVLSFFFIEGKTSTHVLAFPTLAATFNTIQRLDAQITDINFP